MKERPILFSAPMVRAILDGRKSQTRRIIKLKTGDTFDEKALKGAIQEWRPVFDKVAGRNASKEAVVITCPYGQAGDRLWVRETWARAYELDDDDMPASEERTYYRADGEPFSRYLDPDTEQWRDGLKWRPSIFMPRAACRIALEVTSVRVERLNDISKADAIREGLRVCSTGLPEGCAPIYGIEPGNKVEFDERLADPDPRQAYRGLWEHINGPGSWDKNPWVWVVEFQRVEAEA